jgi:hypothetical protein
MTLLNKKKSVSTASIIKEIPGENPSVADKVNLINKLILFPKIKEISHISDKILVSLKITRLASAPSVKLTLI